MAKKEYVIGSGNVFADLGHPRPAEAMAKAELARKVGAIVERRGLTQAAAAKAVHEPGRRAPRATSAAGCRDRRHHVGEGPRQVRRQAQQSIRHQVAACRLYGDIHDAGRVRVAPRRQVQVLVEHELVQGA
jgi:hypothetical protein